MGYTSKSPLHPAGIVDRDGAAASEIDDENGEPDRSLCGGDRQHEKGEDLTDEVVQDWQDDGWGDVEDMHPPSWHLIYRDDDRRIPVRVTIRTNVGAFRADLTEYRAPGSAPDEQEASP